MSEANFFYESEDEDAASSSSENSEDSSLLRKIRKQVRPLSSGDESDSSESGMEEEWKWEDKENIPNIIPFTETPGINALVLRRLESNLNPLCAFKQVLNDDFFAMIARETNRYASQMIANKKSTKGEEWFPVTSDELQAYFVLCIIMSQVKKSSIDMYWSNRAIVQTPIFSKTMPRKRFLAISHFLHFTDNETVDKDDKLKKVRNVVDYLNEKFLQLYTPNESVAIDESLMKFRGRLSYVQFIASKRARFGVKFYKLCESKSGYCSQFKIYVGREIVNDTKMPVSQLVVMKLAESILGKGYTLYLDNWYSSPALFDLLRKNKVNVVGTVRKQRKNMPKQLSMKIKRGEVRTLSSNGVLSLHWHDKKDVYMISTKHVSAEMTNTGKKRKMKNGEEEQIIKPKCIIEYNSGMGGVDKQDQLLACFPIMRKCVKGYKKIFFYMVDIAVYNAYVLYSNTPNAEKLRIVNFRLSIAEDMLSTISLPNYLKRGRPLQGNCPTRLQAKYWAHFPEHIPATDKKEHPAKRCIVCTKQNIRSETTWQCKKCQIPLHIPNCFEKFHTLQKFNLYGM